MRFGELGKAVPGLSDRLLSQRLRELEDEGLVEREVEAGTPVRVTYSLTETGADLGPAIRELKAWASAGSERALTAPLAALVEPARISSAEASPGSRRARTCRALSRSAATRASCRRRCASGRGCC